MLYNFDIIQMLDFFYDSLESLKKVKKPTWQEVWKLAGIIFVVVIISALLFAFIDSMFGRLSVWYYNTMMWF